MSGNAAVGALESRLEARGELGATLGPERAVLRGGIGYRPVQRCTSPLLVSMRT
jgi:hypothetical protein